MPRSPASLPVVLGLLRGRSEALTFYSLIATALGAVILSPLSSGLLHLMLDQYGRPSVANFEVMAFLTTPVGAAGVALLTILSLASWYAQYAGLMVLVGDRSVSWGGALLWVARHALRLIDLGARQSLLALAIAIPFLVIAYATFEVFWAGRDLNGLIILRPPEFWIGVAVGTLLVLGYSVTAVVLLSRWLFAVPNLIRDPSLSARAATRLSIDQTRGHKGRLARIVGLWLAGLIGVNVLSLTLYRAITTPLLELPSSTTTAVIVTGLILAGSLALSVALSIGSNALFVGTVWALYHDRVTGSILPLERAPRRFRRIVTVATLGLLALAGLSSYRLLESSDAIDRVEITAHRAGGARAPENTLAALRQAILDKADWAEIDVQRTADDHLVILHDTDLARIGGPARSVGSMTFAEIRALDVGAGLGSPIRGEKVPTLREFLDTAGSQIRLNIELKPHGPTDVEPLTKMVVAEIQAAGAVDRVRLCSQSYEALRLALEREPRLTIGFIAGNAIGDLTRLDVDFLMVSDRLVTRQMVAEAALRGKTIHAWTVNDPNRLAPLLDAGATNIITDDPAAMRARLEELRALDPVARLLLTARHRLID